MGKVGAFGSGDLARSDTAEAVEVVGGGSFDLASSETYGVGALGQYVDLYHELRTGAGFKFNGLDMPYAGLLGDVFSRHGWRGVLCPRLVDGFALPPDAVVGSLDRQRLTDNGAGFFRFDPNYKVLDGGGFDVLSDMAKEVRFERDPYAVHNWEIFFHCPTFAAKRLSEEGKFEDAIRLIRAIFDPTVVEEELGWEGVDRFWFFRPFQALDGTSLSDDAKDWLAWERHPFDPHGVAAVRVSSYQLWVHRTYVNVLIDWADALFREDSLESLGLAAQLYVNAAELLGPRPVSIRSGRVERGSYRSRRGTAGSDISHEASGAGWASPFTGGRTVGGVVNSFGVPPNEMIEGLRSLIEDRLFKIRNSFNIDGTFRVLPLYQPPIDPALLVRAAALGLSIGDVARPGTQGVETLPKYRAASAAAARLVGEARSLGQLVLSMQEKRDSEELGSLRMGHELELFDRVVEVRRDQVLEAERMLASLEASVVATSYRVSYYEKLISTGLHRDEEREGRALDNAKVTLESVIGINTGAAVLSAIGTISLNGGEWGSYFAGVGSAVGGGSVSAAASVYQATAGMAARSAGHFRRNQEWGFQKASAERELRVVRENLEAARVRVRVAEKELSNAELQVEQKEAEYELNRRKFTSLDTYEWAVSESRRIYRAIFDLSFDAARLAERAWQREIGDASRRFIQSSYFDLLRSGLLAGERLATDLSAMDYEYLRRNSYRHEMVKDVSLAEWDPEALTRLRSSGVAFFSTAAAMFDADCPGHFDRRFISLAVSVVCVRKDGTSVPLKVTLISNRVERGPSREVDGSEYEERLGNPQSIVTSTGVKDTGVISAPGDRSLPFEGEGVIGAWMLELPQHVRPFDYKTITDVVLHISYAARDGGVRYRDEKSARLKEELARAQFGVGGRFGRVVALPLRAVAPDAWFSWVTGESTVLEWTVSSGDLPAGAEVFGNRAWKVMVLLEAEFDSMSAKPAFSLTGPGDGGEVFVEEDPSQVTYSRSIRQLDSGSIGPVSVFGGWSLEVTSNAAALEHLKEVVVVIVLGDEPTEPEE